MMMRYGRSVDRIARDINISETGLWLHILRRLVLISGYRGVLGNGRKRLRGVGLLVNIVLEKSARMVGVEK